VTKYNYPQKIDHKKRYVKIHTNLVNTWRKQLTENGSNIFLSASARSATAKQEAENAQKEAELYEQIGRLKMELEWLKKNGSPQISGGNEQEIGYV
jgi:transposase-like protein